MAKREGGMSVHDLADDMENDVFGCFRIANAMYMVAQGMSDDVAKGALVALSDALESKVAMINDARESIWEKTKAA